MSNEQMPKPSRRLLAVVFLAVMALVLTACAGGDSEGQGEESPDGTSIDGDAGETGDPQAGGELRLVDGQEPRSLNPLFDYNKPSQRIMWAVFDTLVHVNGDFEIEPGLATSWERVDELTWRFELRDDVEFHNGEPFNADAVVYTIEQFRAGGTLASYYGGVADAQAVDDHTVEVTTEFPHGAIPEMFSTLFVFPPEHYEDVGGEGFGQEPIGTGPYEFAEWQPGTSLTVQRNEDYWGDPKPQVERVTWTWAADVSSRLALLQTGEADIILNVPPGDVSTVQDDPALRTEDVETVRTMFLAFNIEDPAVSDPRVRQAVAHAIDREAITEELFEGVGAVPTQSLLVEPFPARGEHGREPFEYDPERAEELLSEVGDVPPIQLHAPIGRYTLDRDVAEAIAVMLENAGFNVDRQIQDANAFFETIYDPEKADGIHMAGSGQFYPHEDMVFRTFFYTTGTLTYCTDPALDTLIDEAVALEDPAAREEAYAELEGTVLYDHICWVPLYTPIDVYGVSEDVQGFTPRPDEYIDFRTITLGG